MLTNPTSLLLQSPNKYTNGVNSMFASTGAHCTGAGACADIVSCLAHAELRPTHLPKFRETISNRTKGTCEEANHDTNISYLEHELIKQVNNESLQLIFKIKQ